MLCRQLFAVPNRLLEMDIRIVAIHLVATSPATTVMVATAPSQIRGVVVLTPIVVMETVIRMNLMKPAQKIVKKGHIAVMVYVVMMNIIVIAPMIVQMKHVHPVFMTLQTMEAHVVIQLVMNMGLTALL